MVVILRGPLRAAPACRGDVQGHEVPLWPRPGPVHRPLITDGRFSGTNNGCFVGHISPEAAEGGPIAVVHDGDKIVIDVESRSLELKVPQGGDIEAASESLEAS